MNDDNTFEGNFTWHEWTFVAPEETTDAAPAEERVGPVGRWDEEWQWTT